MFERFTESARRVVVEAQVEARALGHNWIGTEHLLLATVRDDCPVAPALAPLGLTHDRVRDAVAQTVGASPVSEDAALRDLGIDVDEVRRRVEATFGPGALDVPPAEARRWRRLGRWLSRSARRRGCRRGGHIPFTAAAKKALELSLRESLRLHSGEIAPAHVLLGVLSGNDSMATGIIVRLGVDPSAVRRAALDQLGNAAA